MHQVLLGKPQHQHSQHQALGLTALWRVRSEPLHHTVLTSCKIGLCPCFTLLVLLMTANTAVNLPGCSVFDPNERHGLTMR